MNIIPTSIISIVCGIVMGAILYILTMFVLGRKILLADLKLIRENVFSK